MILVSFLITIYTVLVYRFRTMPFHGIKMGSTPIHRTSNKKLSDLKIHLTFFTIYAIIVKMEEEK